MNIKIPLINDFLADVMQIYPDGDLISAYNTLQDHLNMFQKLDGSPLTYEFVIEKFASHHQQWNHRYGSREQRYLGKEAIAERKTLDDFLNRQMYWQEFIIQSVKGSAEREVYLFGPFDRGLLFEQLEAFKMKFPNETKQLQE
jgi:hypothetical protein